MYRVRKNSQIFARVDGLAACRLLHNRIDRMKQHRSVASQDSAHTYRWRHELLAAVFRAVQYVVMNQRPAMRIATVLYRIRRLLIRLGRFWRRDRIAFTSVPRASDRISVSLGDLAGPCGGPLFRCVYLSRDSCTRFKPQETPFARHIAFQGPSACDVILDRPRSFSFFFVRIPRRSHLRFCTRKKL